MYFEISVVFNVLFAVLALFFYFRLRRAGNVARRAQEDMDIRLEAILNGISGGFTITRNDEKHSYHYVSEAAAGIQGYTVKEFLEASNGNMEDNVYPPDLEDVVMDLERQYAVGDTYTVKYRVVHKDGSLRWIVDSGKRVEKEGGKSLQYSLYQDVTEFEEKAIELKNALTMLNQIVSSLGSGILAYTVPNHRILMINEEACRLFHIRKDASSRELKRYLRDRVMPDNGEAIYRAVGKLQKPGDYTEYMFRIHEEKKSPVNIKAETRLLRFEDGTRFILSTMQDVTEQLRLDTLLRQERKQYRNALTHRCEYFYVFDVTQGTVTSNFVTRQGDDMLRALNLKLPVSFDEMNQKWREKFHLQFTNESMKKLMKRDEVLRQFKKGERALEVEYYRSESDTYTRITILLSKNDEDGHVIGFVVSNDITKRRREEEEKKRELLEAKHALEDAYEAANRASNAKSQFLTNMSHDIRTPMNAILGMTSIAYEHLDDMERVRECLDKIKLSGGQLLGLINEVLDMSKIESGKIDLEEEEFNLPELVSNLLAIMKPQIDEKEHDLQVTVSDISHERVIGDGRRLQQVFMNLLDNAVQYTPHGGRIALYVTEKQTNRPTVGCYELVVEDNGIGMSREFLEHLYEPFTRAQEEWVNKIQGAGLGMAITKNIVQMMNGEIQAESEPGKGTRFTVTVFLKLGKEEQQRKTATVSTLSRGEFEGKKALLVEDNDLNREIASEVLHMLGIETDHACNGKEAVDKMAEAEPGCYDVIFMDIQMPVLNGYEAAKAIRALPGDYAENIPIIAMTANAFAEDVQTARRVGMNDHIMKPFDLERLLSALRKWLQ